MRLRGSVAQSGLVAALVLFAAAATLLLSSERSGSEHVSSGTILDDEQSAVAVEDTQGPATESLELEHSRARSIEYASQIVCQSDDLRAGAPVFILGKVLRTDGEPPRASLVRGICLSSSVVAFPSAIEQFEPVAVIALDHPPAFVLGESSAWQIEFDRWASVTVRASDPAKMQEAARVDLAADLAERLRDLVAGVEMALADSSFLRSRPMARGVPANEANLRFSGDTRDTLWDLAAARDARLLQVLGARVTAESQRRSDLEGATWSRVDSRGRFRLDFKRAPGLQVTPNADHEPFSGSDVEHSHDPSRSSPAYLSAALQLEPGKELSVIADSRQVATVSGCITNELGFLDGRVVLSRFSTIEFPDNSRAPLKRVTTSDFDVLADGNACFEIEDVDAGTFVLQSTQWIAPDRVHIGRVDLRVNEGDPRPRIDVEADGPCAVRLEWEYQDAALAALLNENSEVPVRLLLRDLGSPGRRAVAFGFRWNAARSPLHISGLLPGEYGIDVVREPTREPGIELSPSPVVSFDFSVPRTDPVTVPVHLRQRK